MAERRGHRTGNAARRGETRCGGPTTRSSRRDCTPLNAAAQRGAVIRTAPSSFLLVPGATRGLEVNRASTLGYSTGKWDGETLVVDSKGFNGKAWLDQVGHPTADALQVVERFRRRDAGHMDLRITIDDPKAYTRTLDG